MRRNDGNAPAGKAAKAEAEPVSGRKAAAASSTVEREKAEAAADADDGDEEAVEGERDVESSKQPAGVVSNGQRPRNPSRGKGPGKRGGRRKRTSRPS